MFPTPPCTFIPHLSSPRGVQCDVPVHTRTAAAARSTCSLAIIVLFRPLGDPIPCISQSVGVWLVTPACCVFLFIPSSLSLNGTPLIFFMAVLFSVYFSWMLLYFYIFPCICLFFFCQRKFHLWLLSCYHNDMVASLHQAEVVLLRLCCRLHLRTSTVIALLKCIFWCRWCSIPHVDYLLFFL